MTSGKARNITCVHCALFDKHWSVRFNLNRLISRHALQNGSYYFAKALQVSFELTVVFFEFHSDPFEVKACQELSQQNGVERI